MSNPEKIPLLRRILEGLAHRIERHYFERDMRRYEQVAWQVKEAVDQYLKDHSYRFVSGVFPDPEPDWAKVDVRVQVSIADYKLLLKLWEEVDNYAYAQIPKLDRRGVFTSMSMLED